MSAPLKRLVRSLAVAGIGALVGLGAGVGPVVALPPVTVETHVVVRVRALVVEGDTTRPVGDAASGEAGPDVPARMDFRVPWGSAGATAEVHLEATLLAAPETGDALVRCTARTTPPGGSTRVASRDLRLGEDGSELFEIFGEGGRRILLGLSGEKVERAVVHRFPPVGDPVRFLVGVERVDGKSAVLLETNELHTYVGQSVEYSFRRGRDAGLESVRLDILPVSIAGDVITLDASVSGTLPGPGGPSLLSHHERIVASRRATSTLTATAGKPPAGYRFQVTPDF